MGFLSKHGDSLWKLIQIFVWVALLYMKGNFVSREQYESDRREDVRLREQMLTRINDVATDLRILRERRSDDASQNERISDHEARIRALEKIK